MLVATGAAFAQSAAQYPNKSVRIVVPFPPGGGGDFMGRIVAEGLARLTGQSFIVDNRAGGNTVIGIDTVAKAAPDGYTLLVTTDAFFATHWLQVNLPYDSLRDFTLVTPLGRGEFVLISPPSVPADNLRAFIDLARTYPGKLNVGIGSPVSALSFQRFMNATGTRFTIVNYKGGGPLMTDLLGGNIQTTLATLTSAQSLVKVGKVRGYAVSGVARDAGLPEIPTFEEAGVRGFDPAGPLQYTLLAPGKTPRGVVEKLNAHVRTALADPDVKSKMTRLSFTGATMTVAESDKLYREGMERYGRLIKEAGLKRGLD